MTGMSAERIDHWLIVDETRFITAIGAFVIWRAQLNAESFSGNSERNGATHWTKTNCETPAEIASASMDSTNAWADTARIAPPTRKMPAMAHPRRRGWAIAGIFLVGGAILAVSAHAFVESMLELAISAGVSQFVFVQWVAPFLSEFPEKLSAFNWARQITKAPMAVMNLVSSTINQWSILSALIPVIYSISKGTPSAIVFDAHQRDET